MKIRKTGEGIASLICGLLALYILLITSAQVVCYHVPNWWRNEYDKHNTTDYVTGEMSLDDAVYVTEEMLEYCIGRLDSLDGVNASIDGVTSPFFTEREKLHLVDCRNIFISALRIRLISIVSLACLLLIIFFSIKRRVKTFSTAIFIRTISKGYLLAVTAFISFASLIGIIGFVNFTYLFTLFHKVFFDNDLWILNPAEDNLVNIMQEQVFADTALLIVVIFVIPALILAVASFISLKKVRSSDNA